MPGSAITLRHPARGSLCRTPPSAGHARNHGQGGRGRSARARKSILVGANLAADTRFRRGLSRDFVADAGLRGPALTSTSIALHFFDAQITVRRSPVTCHLRNPSGGGQIPDERDKGILSRSVESHGRGHRRRDRQRRCRLLSGSKTRSGTGHRRLMAAQSSSAPTPMPATNADAQAGAWVFDRRRWIGLVQHVGRDLHPKIARRATVAGKDAADAPIPCRRRLRCDDETRRRRIQGPRARHAAQLMMQAETDKGALRAKGSCSGVFSPRK